MIEKESLAINPIVVSRKADTPKASDQKNTGQKAKKKVVPVAVREVKAVSYTHLREYIRKHLFSDVLAVKYLLPFVYTDMDLSLIHI